MHDSVWGPLTLPSEPALPAPGHCQVWPVPIDNPVPPENAARFRRLLDQSELERAERFRAAGALDTFLTSRAAQRLILGWYLRCSPEAVRIARDCKLCAGRPDADGGARGEHGRPYVAGSGLDFSVSHATGWLLIAVVGSGQVGVDVESVSATRAVDDLADRVFSPAEQQEFLRVPPQERPGWFLRAWTRKEAAVKLTGHGLIAALSNLDVTGPEVVASPPPDQWPADPIHLLDIPSGGGVRAAIASSTRIERLELRGPMPSGSMPSGPMPAGNALGHQAL